MWQTTFGFHVWNSALELKRYMHRFMHEFCRIETLEGVMRTPMNQYESLIKPLQVWLVERGVKPQFGCEVTDVDIEESQGKYTVKKMTILHNNKEEKIVVGENDLCFIQNGSMTDASSVGSWTKPA